MYHLDVRHQDQSPTGFEAGPRQTKSRSRETRLLPSTLSTGNRWTILRTLSIAYRDLFSSGFVLEATTGNSNVRISYISKRVTFVVRQATQPEGLYQWAQHRPRGWFLAISSTLLAS